MRLNCDSAQSKGGGSHSVSGGACEIGTVATLEGMAAANNQLVISNGTTGSYTAAIASSLGISTDLVIEAWQQVSIGGDDHTSPYLSFYGRLYGGNMCIRVRMCISVKKFQRTKFDVSQKPLIQKMHTEPEILNWGFGGVIVHSELFLSDSPAKSNQYQLDI
eukprot:COSAG05_NODE_52_length_23775_cov_49.471110_8_plen_162_part_00